MDPGARRTRPGLMATGPHSAVAVAGPGATRDLASVARLSALLLSAATLVSCATTLPEHGHFDGSPNPVHKVPVTPTAPVQPAPQQGTLVSLADLDGWSADDHAAALAAFRAGCAATRDPALRPACAVANTLSTTGEGEARRFFEHYFRAELLPGDGVLTGYFAPIYPARRGRQAPFTAPVRPLPPANAVMQTAPFVPPAAVARAAPAPGPTTLNLDALAAGGPPARASVDPVGDLLASDGSPAASLPASPPEVQSAPSPETVRLRDADRALIDQAPTDDVSVWMRPEDLFFMQIQGSGVLVLPDGARLRAAYAGDNGKPFVGIARLMARQGLLPPNGTSGDAIRTWLASHAGEEADAVMRRNPRYVFFRLGGDTGAEPLGAAGVPLPPGRAIAMDSSHHRFGELYWISADAPVLSSAAAHYRRLAVALDTGGAIRGPIRADLYFGTGDAAGREAGNVRHTLRLARLVPVDPGEEEVSHAAPPASGRP